MKLTIHLCAIAVLCLMVSCKKDPTKADITYQQLGETRVKWHTGFAFNGDPLAVNTAGESLRWQSSKNVWERVGAGATGPMGKKIVAIAEGADGTYYGTNNTVFDGFPNEGYYELSVGSSVWKEIDFADGDVAVPLERPSLIVNSSGDVVVNANRQSTNGTRSRLFKKAAGSTVWTIINDRPKDELFMVQFSDAGEVFMQDAQGFFIMKKDLTAITRLFNCNGTDILPYCNFRASIASNGEMMLYEGGIGSRKMYRAPVVATYPTTASEAFSLPSPEALAVAMGCIHMANGTTVVGGNDNRGGLEQYFVRRSVASDWQQAPEPSGFSSSMIANRQSQLFIVSQQSGSNDGRMLYQVNY